MKNKPLVIAGVVVAVLLLIVLALPLFINANKFKPKLETQLTSALGRQVTIGNIGLAIFSGGVTVSDVAIADDPKFSSAPFLTAKELSVGVELMPLIFSKRLEVRSITLDSPEVNLIHAANGTWNYSSLGTSSAPNAAPAQSSSSAPAAGDDSSANLTVQKIEIKNGKITVSGTGGKAAKPSVYSDVSLEASDFSATSSFPFKLSAKGPGNSEFKVDGKAGPIDKTDSSLTPLSATLDVSHLDLATTGFIDPSTGIAGLIDFKGDLNSDGKDMKSKGTVTANKFKMSAAGQPSSVPITVDYTTDYTLKSQAGVLSQGDIHIGKAFQQVTGTYDMSGDSTKINMKVHAANMPLGDLEGFLPAVGVVLPSGSKLQGGTMSADLAANGAVDKLTIAGPVNIANTELAGFSLSQKLGALSAFTGLGKGGSSTGTQIQQLSAQIQNDPERHAIQFAEFGAAHDRHCHGEGNGERERPAQHAHGGESRGRRRRAYERRESRRWRGRRRARRVDGWRPERRRKRWQRRRNSVQHYGHHFESRGDAGYGRPRRRPRKGRHWIGCRAGQGRHGRGWRSSWSARRFARQAQTVK